MTQEARQLTLKVKAFQGFPEDQPVLLPEHRHADGPSPQFGDRESWDLAALGVSPSERASLAVFKFSEFPDQWNHFARSFFMLMLNPLDTNLIEAGLHRSGGVPKLKSLKHYFYALRHFTDWAEQQGKSADLRTWSRSDVEEHLAWMSDRYSASAVQGTEQLLLHLDSLGPALPSYFLFETPASTIRPAKGEVKTKPIEPSSFWPLIRACWTYIDVFALDILRAKELAEEERRRWENLPRTNSHTEVRARLNEHFQREDAFVPLHCSNRGPGDKGEINWEGIGRLLDFRTKGGNSTINPRLKLRAQIVYDALDRGVPTRFGTLDLDPAIVTRADGERVPWCPGFDATLVRFEATKLRAACFIFIAAMSMMRVSEVSGLECGSLTTHYGAPALKGSVFKHQAAYGQRGYWWVSDPVARAVTIAEQLAGGTGLLFESTKYPGKIMDHWEEIRRFVEWVNHVGHSRGLEPISDLAISSHRLRRTMAIVTASQPDGEIALGITLKHNATRALANSVTSGYGAPSPSWGRELGHERANVVAAELVADWSKNEDHSLNLRGPGAKTYDDVLSRVGAKTKTRTSRGDARLLRNLLRDEVSTITLGTLNHCLGDPVKAECLKGLTDEAKEAGPILAACSPTKCRNSVITDQHLPIWLAEEKELVELLKDRRMAKSHRVQLEEQLKDVRRITREK